MPHQPFTARVAHFLIFYGFGWGLIEIMDCGVCASARNERGHGRLGDSFHLRFAVVSLTDAIKGHKEIKGNEDFDYIERQTVM